MKVLVTGASSLIGRHVVQLLTQRGDEVTVLQRRPAGLDEVYEVLLDLSAQKNANSSASGEEVEAALVSAMQGQRAVIHLAAKVGVSGRWDAYEATNIEGTRRMISAAVQCKVPCFVHVSSPSVAHAGKSLIGAPAGAADPEHVRGHYARSKALGERIALAGNGDVTKVVSLRPHLVWGPGDTQLVQRIIDKAQAGRLMLVGNGQAFIDTTYIDNAANAIVAGIDNIERAAGQALVISNAQPRTVSEIIQRMLRAGKVSTRLRRVPSPVAKTAGSLIETVWEKLDRQGDPPMTRFLAEQLATAHWFDQRTTQQLLNWTPSVSIEEGFERLAHSLDSSLHEHT